MFWDRVSGVYDLFGKIYNGKVNQEMCRVVAKELGTDDCVLECACGTGLITAAVAGKCSKLVATDCSEGMLKQTRKKCGSYSNVEIRTADILNLPFPDESFDAVIAANVIHLLDDPYKALSELDRICRPGGKLIIPTYVNKDKAKGFDRTIDKAGADFKQDFEKGLNIRIMMKALAADDSVKGIVRKGQILTVSDDQFHPGHVLCLSHFDHLRVQVIGPLLCKIGNYIIGCCVIL